MIDTLILTRIVSDFMWEHKELSVISSALFFSYGCAHFLASGRTRFKLTLSDFFIASFILLLLVTEALNPATHSPLELLKFVTFFAVYVSARIAPPKLGRLQVIAMISLLALAAFSVASITGYGYQTWGRVHTFSGGYFFKTDMALSALILLCLALVGLRSKALSLAAVSMAGYLTLLTNTRIAIPLILAIPLLTG